MQIQLSTLPFMSSVLAVAMPVQDAFARPQPHFRRDDPPSHANMSGMGVMGGMAGKGGSGGLVDFLSGSSMTQPLLNFAVAFLPKAPLWKAIDKPMTSKKPEAKRQEFWFGPLGIATVAERQRNPNKGLIAMDPGSTSFSMQVNSFPKDITILDANVKILYEDGTLASISNGIYNHHVGFMNTAKAPTALVACPGAAPKPGIPTSVFVSTGEDAGKYKYTPDSNQFDGGYYIGKDQGIFFGAEIINYTNDTKAVYAVVDMDHVPGKGASDVASDAISVTQCDGGIGLKPKGGQKKWSVVSRDMTVQKKGYIFNIRGHLHDGGISIALSINNKTVCESEAVYGGAGKETGQWATIGDMTECSNLIEIKKGDILTLRASYDLELHPARQHSGGGMAEEMGLVKFRFADAERNRHG